MPFHYRLENNTLFSYLQYSGSKEITGRGNCDNKAAITCRSFQRIRILTSWYGRVMKFIKKDLQMPQMAYF